MSDQKLEERYKAGETLIQVDIVTAEKPVYSDKVKFLNVTGEEGELGIYPGHSPLLSILRPGEIRFIKPDDQEENYYISGGFLEVQPDHITILADTVLRAKDIDEKRALEAKEKAEKMLKSKHPGDYTAALIELTKALAQIRVAKRLRKLK